MKKIGGKVFIENPDGTHEPVGEFVPDLLAPGVPTWPHAATEEDVDKYIEGAKEFTLSIDWAKEYDSIPTLLKQLSQGMAVSLHYAKEYPVDKTEEISKPQFLPPAKYIDVTTMNDEHQNYIKIPADWDLGFVPGGEFTEPEPRKNIIVEVRERLEDLNVASVQQELRRLLTPHLHEWEYHNTGFIYRCRTCLEVVTTRELYMSGFKNLDAIVRERHAQHPAGS